MLNIIKPDIDLARGGVNASSVSGTGLDCSNVSAISDGTKLTCLAVDWAVPYYIMLIFAAAGGFITRNHL